MALLRIPLKHKTVLSMIWTEGRVLGFRNKVSKFFLPLSSCSYSGKCSGDYVRGELFRTRLWRHPIFHFISHIAWILFSISAVDSNIACYIYSGSANIVFLFNHKYADANSSRRKSRELSCEVYFLVSLMTTDQRVEYCMEVYRNKFVLHSAIFSHFRWVESGYLYAAPNSLFRVQSPTPVPNPVPTTIVIFIPTIIESSNRISVPSHYIPACHNSPFKRQPQC